MELLRGILTVLVIMIVAGAIAYIGDRVGHQVGRRRLTLFGLRPKYTSTVVAVGTGMLIALSVTLVAIASSRQVQEAFFRIGTLTGQIERLQAQSDALENKTRNGELVIGKDTPLQRRFVVLQPNESRDQRYAKLVAYFDSTVNIADQVYTQNPFNLRPYPFHGKSPEVAGKLRQQLDDPNIQRNLRTNNAVLMLAVAPENLYRGDTISFAFASWQDRYILAKDQIVGALDYLGGSPPDLSRLVTIGILNAIRLGMPPPFTQYPQFAPADAPQIVTDTVARGKGVFRVTLLSAAETYSHSAALHFRLTVSKVGSR